MEGHEGGSFTLKCGETPALAEERTAGLEAKPWKLSVLE